MIERKSMTDSFVLVGAQDHRTVKGKIKMKRRFRYHLPFHKLILYLILFLLAALIWIPIYMMTSGTLIGPVEIDEYLSGGINGGYVNWPIFPIYPTLKSYVALLLDTPNFFVMFGNSVKQVLPAL